MSAEQSLHETRFPGESDEYRSARDELLRAESDLREHIEAVAEQRRRLPRGGKVQSDYAFRERAPGGDGTRAVRLSELFEDGKDTLFLYSFMFVPDGAGDPLGAACPSCTAAMDAVSAQVRHLTPVINVAVAAKVPLERLRAHAELRGWPEIRLLSSAGSAYNRDYAGEAPDGRQQPMANVFVRRGGDMYHHWGSELRLIASPAGQDPRHLDFMWPLWSILDLTPAGRGSDWRPQLDYA